jgi:hypothetical protein
MRDVVARKGNIDRKRGKITSRDRGVAAVFGEHDRRMLGANRFSDATDIYCPCIGPLDEQGVIVLDRA